MNRNDIIKFLDTDDKKEMPRAALRHYPDCVIQQCTRHYMTKISRELAVNRIKIIINAKQEQLDKYFGNNESEYIPPTRCYALKQTVKLSNEIADLEFNYELLIDFQNIIGSIIYASSYEIAQYRSRSLKEYFWPKRFEMRPG